MKRLDALFEIHSGVQATEFMVSDIQTEEFDLALVCPAKTQKASIAGWISRDELAVKNDSRIARGLDPWTTWPSGTIHVSTDGEGSHTYTHVSVCEFLPNSNVAVIVPSETAWKSLPLSQTELAFYAYVITANRPRFCYARKPKGERLASIMLPERHEFPKWLRDINLDMVKLRVGEINASPDTRNVALQPGTWKEFKLQDIFDIRKGNRLPSADMVDGDMPFIGASDANNGITGRITPPEANGEEEDDKILIHEGNTITVSYNGSVGEAFYQSRQFWASDDVNVLYPRFDMTPMSGLFVSVVLRHVGKQHFNYGRKWKLERMNPTSIRLPSKNGKPDVGFMEEFMRSLPLADKLRLASSHGTN